MTVNIRCYVKLLFVRCPAGRCSCRFCFGMAAPASIPCSRFDNCPRPLKDENKRKTMSHGCSKGFSCAEKFILYQSDRFKPEFHQMRSKFDSGSNEFLPLRLVFVSSVRLAGIQFGLPATCPL